MCKQLLTKDNNFWGSLLKIQRLTFPFNYPNSLVYKYRGFMQQMKIKIKAFKKKFAKFSYQFDIKFKALVWSL